MGLSRRAGYRRAAECSLLLPQDGRRKPSTTRTNTWGVRAPRYRHGVGPAARLHVSYTCPGWNDRMSCVVSTWVNRVPVPVE